MEVRPMSPASTAKLDPAPLENKSLRASNPVVASDRLERVQVPGADDASVRWDAAFVVYGGHGATQSSTIVYEIEPGGHLGWHTDATEETQYVIAGAGELYVEGAGTYPVGPGSVFVLPTDVRHDLANTGE